MWRAIELIGPPGNRSTMYITAESILNNVRTSNLNTVYPCYKESWNAPLSFFLIYPLQTGLVYGEDSVSADNRGWAYTIPTSILTDSTTGSRNPSVVSAGEPTLMRFLVIPNKKKPWQICRLPEKVHLRPFYSFLVGTSTRWGSPYNLNDFRNKWNNILWAWRAIHRGLKTASAAETQHSSRRIDLYNRMIDRGWS